MIKTQRVAYKLFRQRKDGTLGPLFINAKQRIVVNKWLQAEDHPTPGYAWRPGWHTAPSIEINHLSTTNRVWAKVAIRDYYELPRPANQGGIWLIAQQLKVLEVL